MGWKQLLAGWKGQDARQSGLFLAEVADMQEQADLLAQLERAAALGEAPPAAAFRWLSDRRGALLRRFPEADGLACHWACSEGERQATVEHDPIRFLLAWCYHFPVPGRAEAVAKALKERLTRPEACAEGPAREATEGLARLLAKLEGAGGQSMQHSHAMLVKAARAHAGARRSGVGDLVRFRLAGEVLGRALLLPLLQKARLPADELDEVVLELPSLLAVARPDQWPTVGQSVWRCLGLLASGDVDPQAARVVFAAKAFAGLDSFLAACRELEARAGSRLPAGTGPRPLAWPVHVLRHMQRPSEADAARAAAEWQALQPDTVLTAALLAPTWAELAEAYLCWPGLAALTGWLRAAGIASDGGPDGVESDFPDRAAALAAAEAMGPERLNAILVHPAARTAHRAGLYYLRAMLGKSAAEVKSGFHRRYLPAVRALGLLPDRGDAPERYQALRYFARESRRFREAEVRAAATGLANLAATLGYGSVRELEWAMEGRIPVQSSAARRWAVGRYTIRISEASMPTVLVEKNGKPLRSVPAEVRQSPQFAEARALQEEVRRGWERLRQRLEQAMAGGDMILAPLFLANLEAPAGRAFAPSIVLRAWPAGDGEPVDLLGFRTLTGEPMDPGRLERFQVVHPLQLLEAGTLLFWQERLTRLGLTQPFPQLFRELYRRGPGEPALVSRLAGRRVRGEQFADRLCQLGWKRRGSGELVRRVGGQGTAVLELTGGSGGEAVTGPLLAPLSLDGVSFSEVLRDVDLTAIHCAAEPPVQPAAVPAEAEQPQPARV